MTKLTPIRCLITGFEPFGGSTLNPSQALVEAIDSGSLMIDDVEVHTALLPVNTTSVCPAVDELWQRVDPEIVIHLGESAKADRLTLERVALNLLDFDTPDNAGAFVVDEPIEAAGPPARFTTLPVRQICERLEEQGIEAVLSLSAGAYLCNQVMYLSLGHAHQRGGRAVGFVHVPSLPEQVQRGERKEPSMPLDHLCTQFHGLVHHVIDLAKRMDSTSGH